MNGLVLTGALVAALGLGTKAYTDINALKNYDEQKDDVEIFENQIDILEKKIDDTDSDEYKDRLEQIQFLFFQKAFSVQKNILDKAINDEYGSNSENVIDEVYNKAKDLNTKYEDYKNKYSIKYIIKYLTDEVIEPMADLKTPEDKEKLRQIARETAVRAEDEKMSPLEAFNVLILSVNNKFNDKGVSPEKYSVLVQKAEVLINTAEKLYNEDTDNLFDNLFNPESENENGIDNVDL